jgi:flagellar biosynthesis protein FliQ
VLSLFAVGPWMLKTLVDFTHNLYTSIPTVIG